MMTVVRLAADDPLLLMVPAETKQLMPKSMNFLLM
jgi:hypothetical protein